jgi:hypothetical protein
LKNPAKESSGQSGAEFLSDGVDLIRVQVTTTAVRVKRS